MDQSKVKMIIFLRGSNLIPKEKKEVAKMGKTKGGDGFRGRPSQH